MTVDQVRAWLASAPIEPAGHALGMAGERSPAATVALRGGGGYFACSHSRSI